MTSSAAALRRKSVRWMMFAALAVLLSIPPYFWFGPLWAKVSALGGAAFVLAAAGFGLLLVIGPIGFLCCLLAAIFMRAEACTQAGEHPRGMADVLALASGLLISFAPALGVLYMPIKALTTGEVRYKFPAAMVRHDVDPLGYWQGVGFWFMGAAALAVLAGIYWRSRWQRRKRAA